MQKYNKKPELSKIFSISGYAWLILVINQEEIGARLGLSRTYVKHLPMFREYVDLQAHRYKKSYIYHRLADKYSMHHDSVKRVVSRLLRVIDL